MRSQALLTLNSCPMFTYQDRDFPKMPSPNKIHLPVLAESMLDEMSDDNYDPKHDQVDPTLLKLPAALLKGTFAKAYKILTEITAQIGWDTLLKCRSSVFVMEEEYREEKKNSSVATLRGTPRPSEEGEPSENDSEIDVEVEAPQTNGNGNPTDEEKKEAIENGGAIIEKPEHTVMPEEVKAGSEESSDRKQAEKYTHIHNKRLCERWLDNLFMVLYEVTSPSHLPPASGSIDGGGTGSACVHHLALRVRSVQTTIPPL
jgi:hypothetical protein